MLANIPSAYRETIAAMLRALRPGIEVMEIDPQEIDAAVESAAPDLVICSWVTSAIERHAPSWVVLYAGGSDTSLVTMEGRTSVRKDIDFTHLLTVVDQACALAASS